MEILWDETIKILNFSTEFLLNYKEIPCLQKFAFNFTSLHFLFNQVHFFFTFSFNITFHLSSPFFLTLSNFKFVTHLNNFLPSKFSFFLTFFSILLPFFFSNNTPLNIYFKFLSITNL